MSNRGGKPVCTQIDVQCDNGTFLKGINGNTKDCKGMTVVKGTRFKSYGLKAGGSWQSNCRREWTETTTTPGGKTCSAARQEQRCHTSGNRNGGITTCNTVTIPGTCTSNPDIVTNTPSNNGLKNWSYINEDTGQYWCTSDSVTDPTTDSNDCPAGTVQVGIHNAYTVWCAALSLKY